MSKEIKFRRQLKASPKLHPYGWQRKDLSCISVSKVSDLSSLLHSLSPLIFPLLTW